MSQMRQFDWVPEEELQKSDKKKPTKAYFAEGVASFCVQGIEDGIAGSGNPKTMFKLSIIDSQGKTGQYTVHVAKSAAWQFRNIFNAVGKGIYRKGGYCDDDILNKNGKLVFADSESEEYGVQSKVVEWLPYDGNNKENPFMNGLPKAGKDDWEDFKATAVEPEVEVDDIPF